MSANTKLFLSDNTATICPEIFAAVAAANAGLARSYGEDPWSRRLDVMLGHFFGTSVRTFIVSTGTAANALSLAALSNPFGAIFAHEEAHIATSESSAPEFFCGGARVVAVHGENGRIGKEQLLAALDMKAPTMHSVQPTVFSLTQATECGTAYRASEIAVLSALAHSRGLKVHMDGSRFANALAFLGCHPADITWRAGVDVLFFGATKNGALAAEAVVFFDPAPVRSFELHRKRAGQLPPKLRYAAAQFLAYIESGAWLRNATRANELARKIGAAAGSLVRYPVETNQVFLNLDAASNKQLRAAGFEFTDWGTDLTRFVVSWDQPEADVDALCEALKHIARR